MSINYIISSHPGKIESRIFQNISPYVLSLQLLQLKYIFQNKNLLNIKNNIGQITVVKTKSKNDDYYLNYYDSQQLNNIEGVPLVFLEYVGENIDHSYDQWLQGMEAYNNFDYFLFVEDDYCIDKNNLYFDNELIDIYKENFTNNNGYLCSLTLAQPFHHAAISNGIINKNTSNLISTEIYYDNNNIYNYRYKYPQLRFSEMLLNKDIEIYDTSKIYITPFWDTTTRSIKYFSNSSLIKKCFVPIQDTSYIIMSNEDIELELDKNLYNKI